MPAINYAPFEAYYASGLLRGVFVSGCVERGDGSSFRRKAHAHVAGDHAGWICVRSPRRLYQGNPAAGMLLVRGYGPGPEAIRPSYLMWHELAHLFVPDHWHDDTFRRMMVALCGRHDVPKQRRVPR